MGREIRRVIPNWEHPKIEKINFLTQEPEMVFEPMYDKSVKDELAERELNKELYLNGEHAYQELYKTYEEFLDYYIGGELNEDCFRPHWEPEEATWWQVYETVSEGTPVSPPFETREELVDYLVENGDFWDQRRREEKANYPCDHISCDPWPRDAAEQFVFHSQWAPSFVMGDGWGTSGVRALSREKK